MFTYTDTAPGMGPSFDTIVSPEGRTFVEIRGDELGSEDAYRQLLDSFEHTDVNTLALGDAGERGAAEQPRRNR
jgi:hypothetical protein